MRYLLLINLLILGCDASTVTKRYVQPTNGYAQMVVIEQGDSKTLQISGQIGAGEDLEEQLRNIFEKLQLLIESEGGTFNDIVKINTYIVDYQPEDLEIFRDLRKEILTNEITPASTLVGVSALALPNWLVEIDAVVIIN